MELVYQYLIIINILTFLMFGIDKRKAIKNKWRIPEKTLLLMALIGGSIGGGVGMQCFHHKTKKKIFSIGIPLMLVIHIGIIVYFLL